ncbi:hypothetical protein BOX15_Mlig008003g2, partial [Macrostomum lignano]
KLPLYSRDQSQQPIQLPPPPRPRQQHEWARNHAVSTAARRFSAERSAKRTDALVRALIRALFSPRELSVTSFTGRGSLLPADRTKLAEVARQCSVLTCGAAQVSEETLRRCFTRCAVTAKDRRNRYRRHRSRPASPAAAAAPACCQSRHLPLRCQVRPD